MTYSCDEQFLHESFKQYSKAICYILGTDRLPKQQYKLSKALESSVKDHIYSIPPYLIIHLNYIHNCREIITLSVERYWGIPVRTDSQAHLMLSAKRVTSSSAISSHFSSISGAACGTGNTKSWSNYKKQNPIKT